MRHQESLYAFLSRRDGPDWGRVRQALDLWASRYQGTGWEQTVMRFKGGDPAHERGSFWEFYLGEVFHRLALSPVPAERLERTPDFRLTGPMGTFFVEGTTIGLDEAEDVACLAPVYDRINGYLKDPRFTLSCDPIKIVKPTDQLLDRLISDLSRWLGSLDPESFPDPWMTRYLRRQHAEEGGLLWASDGMVLEFWAIPVPRESRAIPRGRILGTYSWTGVRKVEDHLKIRQALSGKAKNYLGLTENAPFIVALLSSRTTSGEHEFGRALFGLALEHGCMIQARHIDCRWFAELEPNDKNRPMTDGLWLTVEGPQHTNVSAVITGSFIGPYNAARTALQIWHNPWADYPLGDFLPWQSHRVDPVSGEWHVSPPTMQPWELLGVPEGWPEL